MSMRETRLKALVAAVLLTLAAAPGLAADAPGLGKPITEADIKGWDITILPDGTNLPPGSGTAAQGAAIFAQKCAGCHGEGAKGGSSRTLVGAPSLTEAGIEADKTIGNFWADPTTLFDYIRRAMPWRWDGQPAVLQSRAWDESGAVQPLREEFVAARGETKTPVKSPLAFPNQHYNSLTSWGIDGKGEIKHVYA